MERYEPTIHTMDQRSPEWFEIRRGKLTASRVSDALAKLKSGGVAASVERYQTDLVLERLGCTPERFVSADMEHGTNTEAEAAAAYEYVSGNKLWNVGFADHGKIKMFGCSPDGLIGADGQGMVEIKCPASHTHIKTLLGKTIEKKYRDQMQAQMLVCNREWCDFVSYDPRMPPHLTMYKERVFRLPDDEMEEFENECFDFLFGVDQLAKKLAEMGELADVA